MLTIEEKQELKKFEEHDMYAVNYVKAIKEAKSIKELIDIVNKIYEEGMEDVENYTEEDDK